MSTGTPPNQLRPLVDLDAMPDTVYRDIASLAALTQFPIDKLPAPFKERMLPVIQDAHRQLRECLPMYCGLRFDDLVDVTMNPRAPQLARVSSVFVENGLPSLALEVLDAEGAPIGQMMNYPLFYAQAGLPVAHRAAEDSDDSLDSEYATPAP